MLDLTTAPGVLTLLLAAVVVFLVYRRSQEIRGKLQRANADLVEGHARLSTMLRSMGDAVIATDAQARVTLLNPVAELMTGWTQAQAMGQPVDSVFCIVNKQTRAAEVIPVGAALAKGTIQGLTNHMVLIARDRREFDISDSCAPIRDANQNVIGAILVFRDVTRDYAVQQALKAQQIQLAQQNDELRRSQEALVQASALQNAIFNSANFSSIATDAQGVIQIFNVGAQRMLGYAAVDVLNKSTPADISDPQEVIARALTLSTELATTIAPGFEALVFKASRGIEDIYELTYIRKDGSRFPAVVSVTALRDEHDAIIGYLLIGTDNTARKRVDAERGQVEQALQDKNVELEAARALAEKANLAKSDFLSSMSHELRTPLGAILGFAQLIESGNPAPTVAQKRSIDQILKAGWYLLDLINEILDLALIESGRLSLSLEPVSLAEVLSECEAMIEPQARQRGIQLQFVRLATSHQVLADRIRVKQVLINLLSNAIKYNKLGGSVTVECTPRGPSVIRVSVRDTGAGLAPEMVAQLFQPFNRLGQTVNPEEGTGIGLVVSKRLVELMQGHIGVDSTIDHGSVFWFELRLTRRAVVQAAADALPYSLARQTSADIDQRTLLYVEDNPANLILVEDLIARRPDMRLLSAMDGNVGVELARTTLPDVILMDINLPGISGLEALSILARDPHTAHIPVMALSANAMPRDIEKGLEAGFFRYLTKPIKINEFMDALDQALQLAQNHSPGTPEKGTNP